MSGPGRREAICAQAAPAALTGIDFVWVNPADHRQLAVFFIIDPDELARPVDTTHEEFTATITGREDGSTIGVSTYAWIVRLDASGNPRLTLQIDAEREGGFQTYRLSLVDTPDDGGDPRLDAFCDEIDFSFKQPCPSPFDCRATKECPPQEKKDFPVDYLARDFESLRNALIAYAEAEYPQWDAKVPADFGGMMSELFAALGDEFAYIQDRLRREGHLPTLTQRRSFDALARLVDFRLDPGEAASGLVVMRTQGAVIIPMPAGAPVWADQEDGEPVPFEVGRDFDEWYDPDAVYPVHPSWTDIPVYPTDPAVPCLPVGTRELYLDGTGLLATPLPPDVLAVDIGSYWVGKTLLLETRPTEPQAPVRRHLVTLDEPVEQLDDPLLAAGPLLRLHWRAQDALPFELDQTSAFVSANLVPVRAGYSIAEDFVTGETLDPALAARPRSIERAGAARDGGRPAVHRFTLQATVERGLGWRSTTDAAGVVEYRPDVRLRQVEPLPELDWTVRADGLGLGPTDEGAAVEAGRYGVVARHERRGIRYEHRDYIDDRGYTLRFGAGVFGRAPVEGGHYVATYRTGPGASANLPPDTITRRAVPASFPPPQVALPGAIASVTNPFAIAGGRDPQSLDLGRRIAPAAYKALVYRAVRDEDYEEQVERLDWVQQSRAVTRFVGAWPATFVTADPEGAFEISPSRWAELTARLSAVRQTGRSVIPRQPMFQPIDLRIAVCVEQGAAFGHVAAGIVKALAPPGGFFDPDRFTLDDDLYRPALEAAIAAVPGVRAVREIRIRLRGFTGYFPFTASSLPIAADRILKLENDPERPGQGSIRVYDETIPDLVGA